MLIKKIYEEIAGALNKNLIGFDKNFVMFSSTFRHDNNFVKNTKGSKLGKIVFAQTESPL